MASFNPMRTGFRPGRGGAFDFSRDDDPAFAALRSNADDAKEDRNYLRRFDGPDWREQRSLAANDKLQAELDEERSYQRSLRRREDGIAPTEEGRQFDAKMNFLASLMGRGPMPAAPGGGGVGGGEFSYENELRRLMTRPGSFRLNPGAQYEIASGQDAALRAASARGAGGNVLADSARLAAGIMSRDYNAHLDRLMALSGREHSERVGRERDDLNYLRGMVRL